MTAFWMCMHLFYWTIVTTWRQELLFPIVHCSICGTFKGAWYIVSVRKTCVEWMKDRRNEWTSQVEIERGEQFCEEMLNLPSPQRNENQSNKGPLFTHHIGNVINSGTLSLGWGREKPPSCTDLGGHASAAVWERCGSSDWNEICT